MFKWVLPYKKELILGSAAALLYSGADLLFPWGTKLFLDQVLTQQRRGWIPWLTLLLVSAVFARFAFAYNKNKLAFQAAEKGSLQLKKKLIQKLFSLPVYQIEKTPSGHIINLFVHDIDCLKRFYADSLSQFFFSLLYTAVLFSFLLWIDPLLSLFSLFFIPLTAAVFFRVNQGDKKDLNLFKQQQGLWISRLQEVVRMIKTVTVSHQRKGEAKKFYHEWKKAFYLAMHSRRRNALFISFGEAFSTLGLVFLLFFGAYAVLNGRLTLGELLAFYLVFAYLFVPVGRMVSLQETYKDARHSYKRVSSFLALKTGPPELKSKGIPLKNWSGGVAFENVCFGYEPGKPVLKDISFELMPGEKVALVGPSGSGKSTIVRLLCRFHSPLSGKVKIGKQNLAGLDYGSYALRLGLVFQEEDLLSRTLKENIFYGLDFPPEEKRSKMGEVSFLSPLSARLPEKENSFVGERGLYFSGGERKRVALARAFLRDPQLLILDEASASLDSESEREIRQILNPLIKGRTCLIVAHRLSTVLQADRVLVLNGGRIAEEGSPDDLMRRGREFTALFNEQISRIAAGT